MGLLAHCRARGKEKGSFVSRNKCVCSAFSNVIARRTGLWGAIDHTLQVPSFRRRKLSFFLTAYARSSVTEVYLDLRGLAYSMGGNRKPGHNQNKLIIKSASAFMSSQVA